MAQTVGTRTPHDYDKAVERLPGLLKDLARYYEDFSAEHSRSARGWMRAVLPADTAAEYGERASDAALNLHGSQSWNFCSQALGSLFAGAPEESVRYHQRFDALLGMEHAATLLSRYFEVFYPREPRFYLWSFDSRPLESVIRAESALQTFPHWRAPQVPIPDGGLNDNSRPQLTFDQAQDPEVRGSFINATAKLLAYTAEVRENRFKMLEDFAASAADARQLGLIDPDRREFEVDLFAFAAHFLKEAEEVVSALNPAIEVFAVQNAAKAGFAPHGVDYDRLSESGKRQFQHAAVQFSRVLVQIQRQSPSVVQGDTDLSAKPAERLAATVLRVERSVERSAAREIGSTGRSSDAMGLG